VKVRAPGGVYPLNHNLLLNINNALLKYKQHRRFVTTLKTGRHAITWLARLQPDQLALDQVSGTKKCRALYIEALQVAIENKKQLHYYLSYPP
jgi:hypothetical protein